MQSLLHSVLGSVGVLYFMQKLPSQSHKPYVFKLLFHLVKNVLLNNCTEAK